MQLEFLGTCAGMPSKHRNVSATAIRRSDAKGWCLVDCGEGTQHQLLYSELSLHHLHAVLITHVHGDHCLGLPGLLATASMSGRTEPLTLVAPKDLRVMVEAVQAVTRTHCNFPIHFLAIEDWSGQVVVGDFRVDITELSHRVPSYAFGFNEIPRRRQLDIQRLQREQVPAGPEWGRLQQGEDVALSDGRLLQAEDFLLDPGPPRRIVIAGDNDRPELLTGAVEGADVLVHEATYTQVVADRNDNRPQHSSAEMIARFAQHAGVPHLVLTHISPRYGDGPRSQPALSELEQEARAHYRGTLFLARDLARYQLEPDRQLRPL
ncbi:MAG: ribonuclease Z [Marinobacter sp.]|uniref:ribonuclease Z n=1 Tax=Marinobacter sp. TaxID=50741 RepID=UPI00299D7308|nr:ribonuclease Z [Marinobacter sp.]MDX1634247.1 ribonuclease Z [Marinobacter sp.]